MCTTFGRLINSHENSVVCVSESGRYKSERKRAREIERECVCVLRVRDKETKREKKREATPHNLPKLKADSGLPSWRSHLVLSRTTVNN